MTLSAGAALSSETIGRHTAHETHRSEVTVYYPFHPLCGQTLQVIRLRYVDQEPYYVVRRDDGTPLSVPGWMTQPVAAGTRIVATARISLNALLELHRFAKVCLSSWIDCPKREEKGDASPTSRTPKRALRVKVGSSDAPVAKVHRGKTRERPGAVAASPRKGAAQGERR